jgi:hypothetical protein
MKKNVSPKNRNPFAAHAHFRKSGAHGKTKKAQRRLDKVDLRNKY